jgi:hypothetical protein
VMIPRFGSTYTVIDQNPAQLRQRLAILIHAPDRFAVLTLQNKESSPPIAETINSFSVS